jgi:hypothetical protein
MAGNFNIEKNVYLNNGDGTFTKNNILSFNTNCVLVGNSIDGRCYSVPEHALPFEFSRNITSIGRVVPEQNYATDYDGDGLVDILGVKLRGQNYKDIQVVSTTTIVVGTTTQVVSTTTTERVYATSSLFWIPDGTIPSFDNGFQTANIDGDRKPELIAIPYGQNNTQTYDYNATVYFDINHDGLDDKIKVFSQDEPLEDEIGEAFDKLY